jgi:hypothetical protein
MAPSHQSLFKSLTKEDYPFSFFHPSNQNNEIFLIVCLSHILYNIKNNLIKDNLIFNQTNLNYKIFSLLNYNMNTAIYESVEEPQGLSCHWFIVFI